MIFSRTNKIVGRQGRATQRDGTVGAAASVYSGYGSWSIPPRSGSDDTALLVTGRRDAVGCCCGGSGLTWPPTIGA